MKIDRLIGILTILLQREKVTASFLANKFEVSCRTIHRDIEDICKAGIPLATNQGRNGGISIMEGYRIDHTLLTSSDRKAILAGLKSLESISNTDRYQQLMEKLCIGSSTTLASNNHIIIDLSSNYNSCLSCKIEVIQNAIEKREKLCFHYYSPKGEGKRIVEPYLLIFQWAAWYLWGYCCERQDFRLFKITRMIELKNINEKYQVRAVSVPDIPLNKAYPSHIQIQALFEPEMKWILIDEFGADSFTAQKDGKLLFTFGFTDKQYLFHWTLGFGNQVELIEPKELRLEFSSFIKQINQKYYKS